MDKNIDNLLVCTLKYIFSIIKKCMLSNTYVYKILKNQSVSQSNTLLTSNVDSGKAIAKMLSL